MNSPSAAVGWGAISQIGGMAGGAVLALSLGVRFDQADAGRLLLALNLGAFLAPIAGLGLVRMSMRLAVHGVRFVPSGLLMRAAGSYLVVMVLTMPLVVLVFAPMRTLSLSLLLSTTIGTALLSLVAAYYLIGIEEYRRSALVGSGAQRLLRGLGVGSVLWLTDSPSIADLVVVLVALQFLHALAIVCLVVKRQTVEVDLQTQLSHALVDSAISLSSGSITVLPRLAMSDSQYGLYALLLRFVAPVGAARQVIEPLLTARWLRNDRPTAFPKFWSLTFCGLVVAGVLALPLQMIAFAAGLEGSSAVVGLTAFGVLALAVMEAAASIWRGPLVADKDLLFGLAGREFALAMAVVISAIAFRVADIDGLGFVCTLVALEFGWLYSLSRLAGVMDVAQPEGATT